MAEHANFDEWMLAADQAAADAWAASGGSMAFDPTEGDVGVDHVLPADGDELSREERMQRVTTFQALMDFIWNDGPNPIRALKRLFVITRCGSPTHLAHMSQTEVAVLLNETRAATCEREKDVWEEFLSERGFFGTKRPLKKSDEARQKYAAIQKGNVSRKGGRARLRKITALRQQHAPKPKKKTKR